MKKQYLEKILRTELDALNTVIDWKILKGLPYTREAEQHRFLISRLYLIKKEARSSWMGKLAAVPTFFL